MKTYLPELTELFLHSPPDELIKTVNGEIRYEDWLHCRKKELEKSGRTVKIKPDKNGRIALYANPLCFFRGCRKTATYRIYCDEHRQNAY